MSQTQRITTPPTKPRIDTPDTIPANQRGSASNSGQTQTPAQASGSGSVEGKQTPTKVEPQKNSTGSGSTTETPKDGRPPLVFNGQDPEKSENVRKPEDPVKPIVPTTLIPPVVPTTQCVRQKCCRFHFTRYTITKHIKNRVEVPRLVYYSSAAIHQQIQFIHNYTQRVHVFRYIVDHIRLVIKELVINQKLVVSLYQKTDKILQSKKILVEKLIQQKTITTALVDREIAKLRTLLKSLKVDLQDPSACVFVSGKKKCGLIEKQDLLSGESKFYVKDRLFTTVYYVRIPEKIYRIRKDKGYVMFNKRASHWEKRVSRVHLKVRKVVFEAAKTELMKNPSIRSEIAARSKRRSKNRLSFSSLVIKLFTTKFRREYFSQVLQELRRPKVVALRSRYRDVVYKKVEEPALETQEMVALPGSLQRLSNRRLKEVLSFKIQVD
jgi:hypothetical protein